MTVKPKGSVTLPRAARKGIDLFPWCVEVNRALQQLRDRVVSVGGGGAKPSSVPSHPWKASPVGDEFIAIAEGSIILPVFKGSDDEDRVPIVYVPIVFTAASVEITAATGYLYARLAYASIGAGLQNSWVSLDAPGAGIGLFHRYASSVTAVFSESAPASYSPADTAIYWPIAQVSLTDGVASVDKQMLKDNLTHDLVYIGVSSAP